MEATQEVAVKDPKVLAFHEWWFSEQAEVFKEYLQRQQNEHMAQWVGGAFLYGDPGSTAQANARAVGRCEMVVKLLNLTSEDVMEALNDN